MTMRFVLSAKTVHTLSASTAGRHILVDDGIVLEIGSDERLAVWRESGIRHIDLGDTVLTPGWVDSHIHPVMGIDLTRGVDLADCTTLREVDAALRAETAALDDDEWLLGWGLDPNVFGGAPVSNGFLDAVTGDRPAAVVLFDGHSMIASSTALTLGGITEAREFEDASRIDVDPAGRPTGYLLEHRAMQPVQQQIPAQNGEQRIAALQSILGRMASFGATAGQVLDMEAPDTVELLTALEQRGDLPIALRISPMYLPGAAPDRIDELVALQGAGGRRWIIEGVKLIIDGTIDNGTAWLREPDAYGESTHSLWLDPDEYRRAVGGLHERGVPTTTHAIGDEGLAWVAETLAALPRNGLQHRVEHIETLPDDVLDLFVRGGIAASMQPTHCTHFAAADHSDNWSLRLGTERANRAWRTRDLRDRGVPLALGSDWPIAPCDLRSIAADAQLRRRAGRPDQEPNQPAQSLTPLQVLEGFTALAWESVGASGGRIFPGSPATFTVFDRDPLTVEPDAFADAVVILTMIDGAAVVDPLRLFGGGATTPPSENR